MIMGSMTEFHLPKQPVIYEINTPVFLAKLSKKYDRHIKLDSVPPEEWEALASLPVDAVWLMGVWERSPYSRKVSTHNTELKIALPTLTEADNIGSAYSVRAYKVSSMLGGNEGLAHARAALHRHGLGLILDFVPNHIACDHAWLESHPEYLVAGSEKDLEADPHGFMKTKHGIFAYGKDPEFPSWEDVMQLNAFSSELRQAEAEVLARIVKQCDGIRCDMAMLMTNRVFKMTWEDHVGEAPTEEFWPAILSHARSANPDVVFIAEVYWSWERRLLAQGFDYCYDKPLYDILAEPDGLRLYHHLHADAAYQSHLMRFIENHDEERAAKEFKGPKYHAAAFVLATLPGATLYHEGQLEGFTTRVPVQLARGPEETVNKDIAAFYQELIAEVARTNMRKGVWQLCKGNNGFLRSTKLSAWTWTHGSSHFMCVVNYGHEKASGNFELNVTKRAVPEVLLGSDMVGDRGLSGNDDKLTIQLKPWGYALLRYGDK
jgi:glycosidase